jgi:hypothetical protein
VKIRMNTDFGTVDKNYHAGQEVDADKEEAVALIEAGYAEPVGAAPAKRAATRKAPASKSDK